VALGHRPSYSGAMIDDAKKRLDAVQARIEHAAGLAARRAEEVTLIAISKTHDAEAIRPLLDAGHRVFGENRVQEAQAKWPDLVAEFPGVAIHLVGQLQSNKADDAVALFDAIHSVDRTSLVTALARAQDRLGRRPRCFVQVNIGDEPQKGGCAVADLPALLGDAGKADLDIVGLMAVPPAAVEAAPYFALLAKLAREHGLAGLSMGMTADFETAVMLGATCVRIGSALFGGRS
jgi:PLP dependent protein